MGLIDHFLIKVRLEQLNLLAVQSDGTVHNISRVITGSAAAADIGSQLFGQFQHIVVAGHEVNIAAAVVLIDQIHGFVTLIQISQFPLEILIREGMIGTIGRLNDTYFHADTTFLFVCLHFSTVKGTAQLLFLIDLTPALT